MNSRSWRIEPVGMADKGDAERVIASGGLKDKVDAVVVKNGSRRPLLRQAGQGGCARA